MADFLRKKCQIQIKLTCAPKVNSQTATLQVMNRIKQRASIVMTAIMMKLKMLSWHVLMWVRRTRES